MGSLGDEELAKPWIETPLIESAALSKAAGCRVFLKMENLQPSGSFKSRGIGNLILQSVKRNPGKPLHFYSSSGGNAGIACVKAARALGYPATVVIPLSTQARMKAKIVGAGATEVIQTGETFHEADHYVREMVLAKDPNGIYVSPFDHPDIWEGASMMVDEIAKQLKSKPDAFICSVGGGSQFCGVMRGLEKAGWTDVPVLAMETEGADSLNQSLKAGEHITLPGITSIATSLGARRVATKTYENGQRKNVASIVLSDAEAAMGSWRFADDERFLVEVACGVSVVMCYDGRLKGYLPALNKDSKIVIIVCGGSNMTIDMLVEYRKTYGYIEKLATKDADVPSTHSAPQSSAARS